MATFTFADRNDRADKHYTELRRRIDHDTSTEKPTITARATAGGDERRLRGIPCIAHGVAGHIPGTRP